MKEYFLVEGVQPEVHNNRPSPGIWMIAFYIVVITVLTSGCAHEEAGMNNLPGGTQPITNAIAEIYPADKANTVAVNPIISVTLKSAQDTAVLKSATLTLQEGTTSITGTVSYSGATINFTPSADLKPETQYTATIRTSPGENKSKGDEHSWTFTTGKGRDDSAKLAVVSVTPVDGATNVTTEVQLVITFNKLLTSAVTNSFAIKLSKGATTVTGTVKYSGMTATFVPSSPLAPNTVYAGTVAIGNINGNTGDDQDGNGNESGDDDHQSTGKSMYFTWSFTTGGGGVDVTAPTISSSDPADKVTNVVVNIHPSVTFSEAMNSATINSTSFTLKQGSTAVAGSVVYSGMKATFTPSASLMANTVYTVTITTGAKDVAGNALAVTYSWSFTTAASGADVTPPTVTSVTPANNATNVALNTGLTGNFSEAMDPLTITSSTFTVNQGTTSVAGTVTYSGTKATFTPSSTLSGNTVYTVTITTGAKDVAGNALASNYTWSFTSAASVAGVSFASQILPILQSKCMPCHSGSNPPAGITITSFTSISNLSNGQVDNPRMYPKLGVTAAEIALIKAWIAAGRPNN
jgi:hypothetical protein